MTLKYSNKKNKLSKVLFRKKYKKIKNTFILLAN
jgi:hypothetical protein